jgi:hypothetical protein
MQQIEINIVDLTSAILEVRSYFAKRGIRVNLAKKKAQHNFTSGPLLPILIKPTEPGGSNNGPRLFERRRVSGGVGRDSA